MGTSNLDLLIVSLDTRYHRCTSSSQTSNTVSKEDKTVNSVSDALKIKVSPSSGDQFHEATNREDDPATPRSIEHRIPVMAACPPAPRKAKSVPVNRKRKAPFVPVVGVVDSGDFIVYVDAMIALNEAVYVPDIVVGDLGSRDAKKLKLLPAHDS